ncbi:hypothetical protein D9M71_552430 [compost metagenome]
MRFSTWRRRSSCFRRCSRFRNHGKTVSARWWPISFCKNKSSHSDFDSRSEAGLLGSCIRKIGAMPAVIRSASTSFKCLRKIRQEICSSATYGDGARPDEETISQRAVTSFLISGESIVVLCEREVGGSCGVSSSWGQFCSTTDRLRVFYVSLNLTFLDLLVSTMLVDQQMLIGNLSFGIDT